MKKAYFLFFSCLIILLAFNNGCKKDVDPPKSLTEEFEAVNDLPGKGWLFINNSFPTGDARWQQGFNGVGKGGPSGFPAYSFRKADTEYAYAGLAYGGGPNSAVSSWLITPVLEIKNGDKISFYSKAAPTPPTISAADRLQVRLNEVDNTGEVGNTPASVGKFTLVLKDINENFELNGYPQTWTKYEITISGLTAPREARIGFRYFPQPSKSNAIGIDLFEFKSL
ncbi:MAG TPA: choice-of-anchor J domain-containing protein [Chitinophagaceae bacterium]|jgi:hypothetical protein|nr:choice-of-anchor J domain-containing protein [Chitinophagaceae bacterium]